MNLKSFFKRQIMVARVYGIPVRIDHRWFVVFSISVVMIAANARRHPMQLGTLQLPPTGDLMAWTLGIAITLGLFLSVFGHELSHALMGRMEGIEIEEIVLHPFGGLARLRTQPESPGAEFRIAVAGPAASFIFSLIGFGGMVLAPSFHAWFMGLWSVLIGLFLLSAATSVVRSMRDKGPATVAEAMSVPISIEPDLSISRFVDEVLPLHRQTSFPVAHDRRLLGILALEDLKKLPRERWREQRARDVMRPVSQQLFVSESAALAAANELMQSNGVGAVGVIDNRGRLAGFLQRGRVKRRK